MYHQHETSATPVNQLLLGGWLRITGFLDLIPFVFEDALRTICGTNKNTGQSAGVPQKVSDCFATNVADQSL